MEQPYRNGKATPLPDSLWAAISPRQQSFASLERDAECDVAVIGAGFMGLAAANTLARAGKRVMLFESSDVGWGASGRNHGLVTAGLKRDPHEVEHLLGIEQARRLLLFAGDAPAQLFKLIAAENIDCDAANDGWIQPRTLQVTGPGGAPTTACLGKAGRRHCPAIAQ